jgi:hypothetical protein
MMESSCVGPPSWMRCTGTGWLLVDQLTLGLRGVRTKECDRMYGPPHLDARYHQRQRNRRKRK